LHVHFGAGRLGLGLVMGAIVKGGRPFAIVQRPKATWKDITSKGCGAEVDLSVNNEIVASEVVVISEECDIIDYLGRGVDKVIAVVGDRPTLLQLVHMATSFSCSLGPAMNKAMAPLLSELPVRPDGERPVLYACENDHDLVEKVGVVLEGKVDTVACMVDRICTGRTIEPDVIDVSAETVFDGSLVVLDPPSDLSRVPFAGDNVV
ncbi:unnamed protein product, partial [Choristocarpus tenellus]